MDGQGRFAWLSDQQKRIVVDGFAALQQATFANPKPEAIQAFADFRAAGGEVNVPTAGEKAAFNSAVAPVMDWFKTNAKGAPEGLASFEVSVKAAQAIMDAARAKDLQ